MAQPKQQQRRRGDTFASEEDTHRDFVRDGPGNFFNEFKQKEKTYEYSVKEKDIDKTKHDEKYQKHLMLMKVYSDTVGKNNILVRLLTKRPLNPVERARVAELVAKEEDESINRDEERELQQLRDLDLKGGEDMNMQQVFRGLRSIYYYMGARRVLRPAEKYKEWNGEVTSSHEPANALEIAGTDEAKRLSIAVVAGDLLGEFVKVQAKGMKPAIVLCGSRLCPGGVWEQGALGIEEEIYYRSSANIAYSDEIRGGFYILQDDAVLYAPKILLYKEAASSDFARMNDKSKAFFSLLTYAPEHLPEGTVELTEEQRELLKSKFRNAIQTALYWGHDSIIMNPFGEGMPGNYPAAEVTEIFKHVIFAKKHMFCTRLKRVIIVFPPTATRSPAYGTYVRELHGVSHEI